MRKLVILGAALGVLAAMGLVITASAANSFKVVPVVKFNTTEVVPFAGAQLARTDTSVSGFIYSVGVEPSSIYTLWWVVFNNPAGCDGPCDLADVLATVGDNANDNPANIGVFYGGGKQIGPIGAVGIGSTLREGDTTYCVAAGDGPFSALCNPLVDANTAEVHMVVRSHGSMVPGQLQAQVSSFTGGCGVNACANVTAAIFAP
jgi:hypothetical protein